MRAFYIAYSNFSDTSGKLSWSHYCELLSISYNSKRAFYEKEAANSSWSVRELKRQIESSLFERLLLSIGDANKQHVLALAQKVQHDSRRILEMWVQLIPRLQNCIQTYVNTYKVYNGYLLGGIMRFEYDPEKSRSNAKKHGIDFEEAQELWYDDNLLEVQVDFEDEYRSIAIGRIGGKYWTAVITYRDGAVRIISVRRSRRKEVDIYGQEN